LSRVQECGEKGALVDQPVLKREQSEEEVAIGSGGYDVAPIVIGRSGAGSGVPIATEKKTTIFKGACVQWARRAASRADCTAGNSRPIRVKPVRF
jgi:hypothetical protein